MTNTILQPRQPHRLRSILLNTGIVLLALLLSLLLGEWIVRTWMPCPDYGVGKRPALRNNLFMYDPLLGWKGTPSAHSPYISKDFIINVHHDGAGYRNQTPAFIPNRHNSLLLGDSYGWGWGVEDNETAAAVFNQQHPNFNIYNLSTPGYGTDQEWLTLQQFVDQHPQAHYQDVILLFYYNDFEDNASNERYSYPKPSYQLQSDGQLQLSNVPVPLRIPEPVSITEPPPARSMLQNSQLLNFFTDSILKILFAPKPTNNTVSLTLNAFDQQNISITEKLLQTMQNFCISKNMRFHVVFLMTINTDAQPALMINTLASRLQQNGIANSYFYSRTFPRTDLWLDTHYTPYGQALLSKHLSNILTTTY